MALGMLREYEGCEMCEVAEELLYKVGDLFVCKNCKEDFSGRKQEKGKVKKFKEKDEKQ